jgi:hypothetical protein
VFANSNVGPFAPCGAPNLGVWERAAPNTLASWDIYVSGPGGANDIIAVLPRTGTTNAGGWVRFPVGSSYGGVPSCDAANVSTITAVPQPGGGQGGGQQRPGGPPQRPGDPNPFPDPNPNPVLPDGYGAGAVSILNIESLGIDPETGLWVYEGAFHRILMSTGGAPASLNIPDLFADTNGDGEIGEGDVLYSWVDIFTYLQAPPTFSLGDEFFILDGQVAELQGMWFSPTPIFLDPLLGPRPSGGQWYNPAAPLFSSFAANNGTNSITLTAHTIEVDVPEPAAWAMLVVGFGAMGAVLRRRRAQSVFSAA